jgi:hypothetical protein
MRAGIGKVHRIPPVKLKCVSEKRVREMAALVGGDQGSRHLALKSAGHAPSDPLL